MGWLRTVGIALGLRQFIYRVRERRHRRSLWRETTLSPVAMRAWQVSFATMGIAYIPACVSFSRSRRYDPAVQRWWPKLIRSRSNVRFFCLLMQDSAGAVSARRRGSWLPQYDFRPVPRDGAILFILCSFNAWLLPARSYQRSGTPVR